MKRLAKVFIVTCTAAFSLAVVANGASATTTFTASATGEVTSKSTTVQTLTIGAGNVVNCTSAHGTGTITGTATTAQEMTVNYSGCSATFFGIPAGTVDISPATYNFTASGAVHVLNNISIKATGLGCETIVLSGQTLNSVDYFNNSGTLTVTSGITGGIHTGSPNGCPAGLDGAYHGTNVWSRVGGGTISVD